MTFIRDGYERHGTIVLPTYSAIALWRDEILGQFSDGAWENAAPFNHWVFWFGLGIDQGPVPLVTSTQHPKKNRYNIATLYQCVGDRMLAIGRMGKATDAQCARYAAEEMPPTFEEFCKRKAADDRESWRADVMKNLTEDVAKKFYDTTYGMKELRSDVRDIKAAMKSIPTRGW